MLVVFHVQGPAGEPLPDSHLDSTSVEHGDWHAVTDCAGNFITTPPGLAAGHYDCVVSHAGYQDRLLPMDLAESGIITIGLEHGGSGPLPPLPPSGDFPAEVGPLARNGKFIQTASAPYWGMRGTSMFQLPTRYFRGEDITPTIAWMRALGINSARMFVAGVDWAGQIARLWDEPRYDQRLSDLIGMLEVAGIRAHCCVVTYGIDTSTWAGVLQRVYDLVQSHPLAWVEVMNEPWNGGKGDPVAMMRNVNRHGVFTDYGIAPFAPNYYVNPDTSWDKAMPIADGISPHLPRDLEHSPRNGKDCFEMREYFSAPCWSGEPLGVADYDKEGAGARNKNVNVHMGHHGLARMMSSGSVVHSQCGLEGRAPSADEPITASIYAALSAMWSFIPDTSQTGMYCRPNIGDFGLAIRDGDTYTADKAYGMQLGNVQYVVVPMPTPQWEPRLINGWRIAATGPAPYVLKLTK